MSFSSYTIHILVFWTSLVIFFKLIDINAGKQNIILKVVSLYLDNVLYRNKCVRKENLKTLTNLFLLLTKLKFKISKKNYHKTSQATEKNTSKFITYIKFYNETIKIYFVENWENWKKIFF